MPTECKVSVIVEFRIGLRDLVSFTLQKSLIEATKTNKKLFNLKMHKQQMYKDHMKRCLTLLVLREVGIKKDTQFHSHQDDHVLNGKYELLRCRKVITH